HGGHGNASPQVYNHVIMPLASRRDKVTQVRWGIRDFQTRFGREPEGLWLPETAVDDETLEVLAEAGLKFTVLAPHQARRVRPLAGGDWQEVGDRVDPSRPYLWHGPRGLSLALFFYNARLPHAERLAPALARPAAGGARLARRADRRLLRGARLGAPEGPLGRARRLRGRRARPEPRPARGVPRRAPAGAARRRGVRRAAQAPRDAAPADAHAHLVRLVLRRDLRARARPGPPLRGARARIPPRPPRPPARRRSLPAAR